MRKPSCMSCEVSEQREPQRRAGITRGPSRGPVRGQVREILTHLDPECPTMTGGAEIKNSETGSLRHSWRRISRSARRERHARVGGAALAAALASSHCSGTRAGSGEEGASVSDAAPAGPGGTLPRADLLSVLDIDEDGSVNVPATSVPVSQYLSPEGQAWMALHLKQNQDRDAQVRVDGNPVFLEPYLERMNALYPTTAQDTTIGGVHVYDYSPVEGVSERNQNRLLIELHAGAFHECWPACAELQSIPISSLGRIRVVAVDYRLQPNYQHPAPSEDVTAVYKALLETYPAENIGIFGCSAGGELTEMSAAWIQKEGLPRPGALGVYCASDSMGLIGDSLFTAAPLGEGWLAPSLEPFYDDAQRRGPAINDADRYDPMQVPAAFDAVLAEFPPTQIITGTRHFDLSPQLYRHRRLINLGVEAELHVFEGLFHFFFLNPDLPESRDAYNVMVSFFDEHLGVEK